MCGYLASILQLPELPRSVSNVWTSWKASLRPSHRVLGDVNAKAFIWNIWLTRNDSIFNANILPAHAIILKIDHMLLSWFYATFGSTQEKL